jgi:hypothetical protein
MLPLKAQRASGSHTGNPTRGPTIKEQARRFIRWRRRRKLFK